MNQIAIFGGGCFWCTEAVFESLRGVISVKSGYAGGESLNPTYQSVSSGDTGHAEVIRIEFDPKVISYRDLLTVFFSSHDPTTKNRQGNDIGTEYRSIILYTNNDQKRDAELIVKELNESSKMGGDIVTEIKEFDKFFEAEDYHQNYFNNNSDQPYCQFVINPKLEKIQKEFANLLKTHSNENR